MTEVYDGFWLVVAAVVSQNLHRTTEAEVVLRSQFMKDSQLIQDTVFEGLFIGHQLYGRT